MITLFYTLAAVSGLHGTELETARAALHDQLYTVAQTHAERALRLDSTSTTALLVLLEALAAQQEYAAILERIETASSQLTGTTPAGALEYWRATALLRLGRAAEAASIAADVSQADPKWVNPLRQLAAQSHLANGQTNQALRLYAQIDQAGTNHQESAANLLEWATLLSHLQRHEEAADLLQRQARLKASRPTLDYGRLLQGQLLQASGKTAEATTLFNQLAMSQETTEAVRTQVLLEMSARAWEDARSAEAIAYARSACEGATEPETSIMAGLHLGDLLIADPTTIKEGADLINGIVRSRPQHPAAMQALLKLAAALLQAGHPEEAEAQYRIFLESYPETGLSELALRGRGEALLRLKRYAEARDTFKKVGHISSDESVRAEALFKEGDTLLADQRYQEAAQVYAALAAGFPANPLAQRALFQSAETLLLAREDAEALKRYQQLIELFPKSALTPQALLATAQLLDQRGRSEEAIATYTSLIEEYRQPALRTQALLGRGTTHYCNYNFAEAMQDFATVAEDDPGLRDEARFMLTLSLYGLGRDQEARMAASAFLLDFPESTRLPDMMLWLGKLEFNRGHYEDAQRIFLDFISRWPEAPPSSSALCWAARAAFNLNDFSSVIEMVTRLVRSYPDSAHLTEARYLQAEALMELARFDEAILLLEQLLAQQPDQELRNQALLLKADALYTMGAGNSARYQEALTGYELLLAEEHLSASMQLQLHFKMARCLEKLKRPEQAIDQLYTHVILRFLHERALGTWYDEYSTTLFTRAAFRLAELYEQRQEHAQAIRILQRILQAAAPGSSEAAQRIEKLRGRRMIER